MRDRPRRRRERSCVAGARRARPRRTCRRRAPRRVGRGRRDRGRRGDAAAALDDADRRRRRGDRHVLPPRAVVARGRRGGLPRRGARAARLAGRPGRPVHARLDRPRDDAADRAAGACAVRRRCRGAVLSRPQARGARRRRLRRVAVVPHGDVQGAVRRDTARGVLSGPARPGLGRVVGDLPSALLDEHGADLGTRAAVPHALSQRRDQHDRRERRVDGGARARTWARSEPRLGARPARLRLRSARQRGRAAHPLGARRSGGALAPRSAGLAERSSGRRRRAGDAPLPRDDGRAVGRACRPRLQRRRDQRGEARPERPAAAPCRRLRGRARGRRFRSGRCAAPGRRPGPAWPSRPRTAPVRRSATRPALRRRADARAGGSTAVRRLGLGDDPVRRGRRLGCRRRRRTSSRAMRSTATRARS